MGQHDGWGGHHSEAVECVGEREVNYMYSRQRNFSRRKSYKNHHLHAVEV